MNKAYSARLKGIALEDFRTYIDGFATSFGGSAQYGRCPKDMRQVGDSFTENTTRETKEDRAAFHYLYRDNHQSDIVARVTAVCYRLDELSVNLAWDEQAAGAYIDSLIFSIENSYELKR